MLADLLTSRAIQDPGWSRWAAGDDFRPASSSGPNVTEASALSLLAVFRCVRVLADAIATLPIDVYRRKADGVREELKVPMWIEQPNPNDNRIDFVTQQMVSLLLRGNSYALIIRNSQGQILEVWPLHPDWVTVSRPRRGLGPVRYEMLGQRIPARDMLHVRAFMLPGAVVGIDPITYARDGFGLGLAAQSFGADFFAQGSIPSGVLEADKPIDDDQARSIRDRWVAAHSGRGKSNLPAVVGAGLTYKSITLTNEQSQFLETRKFTSEEIEGMFGLGSPLATNSGSSITYANRESRAIDITRFSIAPWTSRLEASYTSLLPRPQYTKFNMDAFLRADTKTRYDTYAVAIDKQIMDVDEVRDLEDLPPRNIPPAQEPKIT